MPKQWKQALIWDTPNGFLSSAALVTPAIYAPLRNQDTGSDVLLEDSTATKSATVHDFRSARHTCSLSLLAYAAGAACLSKVSVADALLRKDISTAFFRVLRLDTLSPAPFSCSAPSSTVWSAEIT